MLDNHGDMVGSMGCGNGVPMWFQKKYVSADLVGKQLEAGFPYNLLDLTNVAKVPGYEHCDGNAEKWAEHAGDPNYNLLNECCLAINSGNPGGTGFTTISQQTMDAVVEEGKGRDDFIRFWKLMAEAVVDHPSAFGFELMNEPMTIRRTSMFDAWVECAKTITQIIPDASVAIADIGEGSVLPAWLTDLTGGFELISAEAEDYIKKSNNTFYAWHYGDIPADIENMQAIS